MREIIYFDVCALILMIGVFMAFYMRKDTPGQKNLIYKRMIWVLFASILLNIITVTIENSGADAGKISVILKMCYLYLHMLLPVLFCFYIVVFINDFKNMNRVVKVILLLPTVFIYILITLTPFTKNIFYYTDEGVFTKGSGFMLTYEVSFAYILISLIYIIFNYKKYKKTVRYSLYVAMVMVTFTFLVESFWSEYLLENFVCAVIALLLLITLESVENLMDNNTGMFTQTALVDALSTYYSSKSPFVAVIIKNADLELIIDRMGLYFVNSLFRDVSDYIQEQARLAKAYFITNECFVLIYPKGSANVEKNIMEIQQRMSEPWCVGDFEMKISEYICRINVPNDASTLELFMDYLSFIQNIKKSENKRIFVDDINLDDRKRKIAVEYALKDALETDSFRVHYQPIYSIEKKKIVSAEALLRLEDPKLGYISPAEFIPLAERNGKIVKIGKMVFEKVCKFISENDLEELGISYIEVNLSVIQCMQADLVEEFKTLLDKYNVDARMICLEITETAAENVPEMLAYNIEEFRKMGMYFALDDYGTGYSNLQKMINLPFTYVKYDKDMIWSALSNERARLAVESNVILMKKLGMKVVAEGVETLENLEDLLKMQFDYIQGYYFSKAISEKDFIDFIKNFTRESHDIIKEEDSLQNDFI